MLNLLNLLKIQLLMTVKRIHAFFGSSSFKLWLLLLAFTSEVVNHIYNVECIGQKNLCLRNKAIVNSVFKYCCIKTSRSYPAQIGISDAPIYYLAVLGFAPFTGRGLEVPHSFSSRWDKSELLAQRTGISEGIFIFSLKNSCKRARLFKTALVVKLEHFVSLVLVFGD